MAIEAGMSSHAMGDFQRWYNQYIATKGRRPPRHLIERFLNANLSAGYRTAEASRRASAQEELQEKQLALSRRNARFTREYQQELLDRTADAAQTRGIFDIARLGIAAAPLAIKGGSALSDLLFSGGPGGLDFDDLGDDPGTFDFLSDVLDFAPLDFGSGGGGGGVGSVPFL